MSGRCRNNGSCVARARNNAALLSSNGEQTQRGQIKISPFVPAAGNRAEFITRAALACPGHKHTHTDRVIILFYALCAPCVLCPACLFVVCFYVRSALVPPICLLAVKLANGITRAASLFTTLLSPFWWTHRVLIQSTFHQVCWPSVTCLLSARFFVINTKKWHASLFFIHFNALIRFVIWCENEHYVCVVGFGKPEGKVSCVDLVNKISCWDHISLVDSKLTTCEVKFGFDDTRIW